jgi:hypothetical protein
MRSVVTIAVAIAPVLAACGVVAVPPSTAPLDLSLTRPCPDEPEIPVAGDRVGLSETATRNLIAWYETNYPWCAATKRAAIDIIERRDARLSGNR